MPRKGKGSKVPKDMPGAPNRAPIIDAPQEQYGQRQALVEAQQAAPPGPPPTANPIEAAIESAAGGLGPPIGLNQPSDGRPITSGIPMGPGPGREAVFAQRESRSAQMLERLAVELDDPHLHAMAQLARQRGL